ncbi:ANTAR domain-containing protein [Streptomyces sp. NBC_01304]|uniref:ANTAR domain-containing protein n=1 Tax=Streptomyces sp. NBC_01304 TaxID=2903818 RepID=UPI002E113924|nr:ANTAR domain-containing protein [Streptomyces sp. NBC_01304]
MNRTVRTREERWALKADVVWGHVDLAPAIVMLRAENDTLRRALASHVVIDQARGMVMALAPCSRGEARSLLVDMARQCDLKLREVAVGLVATSDGYPLPTQLDVALRRALRRLHAAERR